MPFKDNLFRPDFAPPEVNVQMPEWIPMGEDPEINMEPLMGAFKKKLSKPSSGGLGEAISGNISPQKAMGGARGLTGGGGTSL